MTDEERARFQLWERELQSAADDLASTARVLTSSGGTVGPPVSRVIAAIRDFADEVGLGGRNAEEDN